MVEDLMRRGALRGGKIKEAFLAVDRKLFVRQETSKNAYEDYPLPISERATISQPYTVALMLEWLGAREGEKVLEVGSGSGWVVGLLGYIVGKTGKVYGTELEPGLVKFGQNNIKKSDLKNVIIKEASDILGWPGEAPFDRILVSAAATDIPKELVDQLKVEGIMVIPVGQAIYRVRKTSETNIEWEKFDGFVFVPLIG
ncbi:MAG: protein-L-isoaspartate O-methyltransferase [Candidatus Absconditabacteria bacterium]|nr:protein-L-isoaspartate O-methyltransferase [Candidatus Absconditabacteria bacterium]